MPPLTSGNAVGGFVLYVRPSTARHGHLARDPHEHGRLTSDMRLDVRRVCPAVPLDGHDRPSRAECVRRFIAPLPATSGLASYADRRFTIATRCVYRHSLRMADRRPTYFRLVRRRAP